MANKSVNTSRRFDQDLLARLKEIVSNTSQAEIARKTGTSPVNVNHYLQGTRIPASFLVALVEGLNVNPGWLLTGQGNREATHIAELKPATKGVVELVNVLRAIHKIRFGRRGESVATTSLRELNTAMREYGNLRKRIDETMSPILGDICNDIEAALKRGDLSLASDLCKAGQQLREICSEGSSANELYKLEARLLYQKQDMRGAMDAYSVVYWRSISEHYPTATERTTLARDYAMLLYSTRRPAACRRVCRSVLELVGSNEESTHYHTLRFLGALSGVQIGLMQEDMATLIDAFKRLPEELRASNEHVFKSCLVLSDILSPSDLLHHSAGNRRGGSSVQPYDYALEMAGVTRQDEDLKSAYQRIKATRGRMDLEAMDAVEAYVVLLHDASSKAKARKRPTSYEKLPQVKSLLSAGEPISTFRELSRACQLAIRSSKRAQAVKLLLESQALLDRTAHDITMDIFWRIRHYANIRLLAEKSKPSKGMSSALTWAKQFDQQYSDKGYLLFDALKRPLP